MNSPKIRVGAVSYLNTAPLVWGMLHGTQRADVDLSFSLPSTCAQQVDTGAVDIGLVPTAEIARQRLEIASEVGIACRGAVRSILLFSRVPWRQVQVLAADSGSRTSVQLARVILGEQYGVEPNVTQQSPELNSMLAEADAALIIGDAALKIDLPQIGYEWLDLGAEWFRLTGLPMLFAAWAGRPGLDLQHIAALTSDSYEYGRLRITEIAAAEHKRRGISQEIAEDYLTNDIRFRIGADEQRGLEAFLQLAKLSPVSALARSIA